jgi:P-type Cu+ transporter
MNKVAAQVHDHAARREGASDEVDFTVSGMDCASCVAHVEKAARSVPGVRDVNVSLARGRAVVQMDSSTTDPQRVADAITNSGYPATPELHAHANAEEKRVHEHAAHAESWFRRAVLAIALWLPVELLHWILTFTSGDAHLVHRHFWMHWLALITSTIAIVYIGAAFYRSAWGALRRGTSNMDTLIAMGASVAYVYSLVAFVGYLAGWWRELPDLYFMESTGLLALISLGHWLEARARTAAGSAIRELLNLAPAKALRLKADGQTEEAPVAELRVGDRILSRPGDRIAADGVVVDGRSSA